MYPFSQPSESLCRKILSPVPFKERLCAGRLKPPVGILPGDVRSLPELHQFLAPDVTSLPGINLKALPEWVGRGYWRQGTGGIDSGNCQCTG